MPPERQAATPNMPPGVVLALAFGLPHNGPASPELIRITEDAMPSLIRFLVFCGVVAGLIYGGMFALVMYVKPQQREITVRVPTEKLDIQK
jgi:hypothetical protein